MKRSHRIAINVGGPALLASILVVIPQIIQAYVLRQKSIVDFNPFAWFFVILVYAYVLAAVPSILHAWLMERVYRRFPGHTWAAVGCSSLSGLGAGILIAAVFLLSAQIESYVLLVYSLLGLLVGLILGMAILFSSRRNRWKAAVTVVEK